MRGESSIDVRIADLADRQWGLVTRTQLRTLGLSAGAVDRRIAAARLRPLHRGVYALGHRWLRREAHRLAAVLACGDGAVLSHASAAAHWGLRPSAATRIDVTVPRSGQRRRPGIRVHRHAALGAGEVTEHESVPVTTPSRTLLDLAAALPRRSVERALDQAEVLRLFDATQLRALLAAHLRRPGTPLLRTLLDEHQAGTTLTRSELEEAFLRLCDRSGVPRPVVNGRALGFESDFASDDRALVVEVDGFAFHRTRRAFERDRTRDAVLAAAGVRTLRFTARQVERRPV
ncbi:MAG: type IV toxin-antitoxin system AbiEi family antitoxin domain-containing protein [Solirubrobacteraceae bacterium]